MQRSWFPTDQVTIVAPFSRAVTVFTQLPLDISMYCLYNRADRLDCDSMKE